MLQSVHLKGENETFSTEVNALFIERLVLHHQMYNWISVKMIERTCLHYAPCDVIIRCNFRIEWR